MKRRAFTLLELVFVIAIIAVLAAILFPMFARARERARRSSCASNLFQIGTALTLYAQDNDGRFPPDDNEFGPIYRYLYDVSIFFCPSVIRRMWTGSSHPLRKMVLPGLWLSRLRPSKHTQATSTRAG